MTPPIDLAAVREHAEIVEGDSAGRYAALALVRESRAMANEIEALRKVAEAANEFANDREPGLAYPRMVEALREAGFR